VEQDGVGSGSGRGDDGAADLSAPGGAGRRRAAPVTELEQVVVRIAGDSGDGVQLAGDRFGLATALAGNDLATLPDFPAEIRAPAGTVPGVSAFQIHFSDHEVMTPGDAADVLIAMNPAALRASLGTLRPGGAVIVNSDAFDARSLAKANYTVSPLEDGTLADFRVYPVPMTTLTLEVGHSLGAKPRDAERSKNFFALGLLCWLYGRDIAPIARWIDQRFAGRPLVAAVNGRALEAGYAFGETTEVFETHYHVAPAPVPPGRYRTVNGNVALALGLVTAAERAGLPLFLGSYPITPASDLLHELSRLKSFGVRTFQAEDEMAGIGAALGAAFGGALGVTTTSGPGMDLKAETLGLAVALELPLVVVDVQRAGPSTGMPTKAEQADLLAALFGRHGEAPLPVLAPRTPADCFDVAIEAVRIAVTWRTPVILLSDAFLANGAEPWRLPDPDRLPTIDPAFAESTTDGERDGFSPGKFLPYARDPLTLARPWARPGTPGLTHRIGGLEKADLTGDISYDPANHERMVHLRAEKIARVALGIPPLEVDDPTAADAPADLLVLGWGSTYGAIQSAVRHLRAGGSRVAHAHLRYLHPFPANLGEVLARYRRVVVPEMNLGQLAWLLRARYLIDVKSITKVQGVPFRAGELETAFLKELSE